MAYLAKKNTKANHIFLQRRLQKAMHRIHVLNSRFLVLRRAQSSTCYLFINLFSSLIRCCDFFIHSKKYSCVEIYKISDLKTTDFLMVENGFCSNSRNVFIFSSQRERVLIFYDTGKTFSGQKQIYKGESDGMKPKNPIRKLCSYLRFHLLETKTVISSLSDESRLDFNTKH